MKTRNGHNMYDMASMLQKAIRRNKLGYAMYAAYELYGRYYAMLWKRLIVISGEDCYGVITKEIVALKELDDCNNQGLSGYERDMSYVEIAVKLLCDAKKNRDACYVACNFMIVDWGCSEEEFQRIGHVNLKELRELIDEKNDVSEVCKTEKVEDLKKFKSQQISLF